MQDPLDLLSASYEYDLPERQIAQDPVVPRDQSRLLVVYPAFHCHRRFDALPELLRPGDLLVLNDTRVIPARLIGRRPSGGRAELLLIEPESPLHWLCLVKPARKFTVGTQVVFGEGLLTGTVSAVDLATGGRWIRFETDGTDFETVLEKLGQVPLPPYLERSMASPEQYQTVWAARPGAVAAPTAGLHFTPRLLAELVRHGIAQTRITLHVGIGTFRPVQATHIEAHHLHSEWTEVSEQTVQAVLRTHAQGGRVIAVGTTSARALESAARSGSLQAFSGRADLFIYPGYRWRVVDGLITNFHLPRSSLLMLVSGLIGRHRLMELYREAIELDYRFYSFGDAMLILPEPLN